MYRKGFTLIELLVVIAIIGILSAIVLASLGNARGEATATASIATMNQMPNEAALYANDHGSGYGAYDDGAGNAASCPTGGGTDSVFDDEFIDGVITTTVNALPDDTAYCFASTNAYAIALPRDQNATPAAASTYWCVDSSGNKCGNNGGLDGESPIANGACIACTSTN